jgi:hypothetical protein
MSNEFALDWSESSGKSDAKLPPAEYDIVISRFSPPGECEAKDRCVVGSNYVGSGFLVFVVNCWRILCAAKQHTIGTAFSRQRKEY